MLADTSGMLLVALSLLSLSDLTYQKRTIALFVQLVNPACADSFSSFRFGSALRLDRSLCLRRLLFTSSRAQIIALGSQSTLPHLFQRSARTRIDECTAYQSAARVAI